MKEKKSVFSVLIILVAAIFIFFNATTTIHFFPFVTSLFSLGVRIILGVVGFIIDCVIIGLLISGKKKKNIKQTNVNFYDVLKRIKQEDNKVIIDDNSYLLLNDLDTIIAETIDIYMNDEYVGSLNEFQKLYPNAFNNLQKEIVKNSKKQKKSKKQANDTPIQPKEVVKDCAYFITLFQKLLQDIEVEIVKEQIKETISYLYQIKNIEDEFGESKLKTRKLYEYYLPMYADILANYDRLHDNAPLSVEFKENEVKLLKTSDLINAALKNVSASLVEKYHTDLNVDMKTLESILKKDGLVDDLEVNKHE